MGDDLALTTVVRLENLAVSAGRTPIFDSASLTVRPGECVGIAGPNGSGKTTLLRVIATLRAPSGGFGEVFGVVLGGRHSTSIRTRIGLLGHEPALVPELSLADNLRFHAALRGRPDSDAAQALEVVGLTGARYRRAADCSMGMLRRADLGRLLLGEPELLLLDEPTDRLDETARPLVGGAIDACLRRGGAAIVVSHDPAGLSERVDRLHHLHEGSLR